MNQRELVRRLRAARWVNLPQHQPAPPQPLTTEQELASLRERLRLLAISRESIRRHWPFVSEETKTLYLAGNKEAVERLEARIRELGGVAEARTRGVHGLA